MDANQQLLKETDEIQQLALKQTNGFARRAAARLFSIGVRWSLKLGVPATVLSDLLFEMSQEHDQYGILKNQP